MQNHTTTAEIDKIACCEAGQAAVIVKTVFDGLPENKHKAAKGRPRVIVRYDAERIILALDMQKLGLSPKAIRVALDSPDLQVISKRTGRLGIYDAGHAWWFFDTEEEVMLAMKERNFDPLIYVNLASVVGRASAAVEMTEVRWGLNPKNPIFNRSQEEIKAAAAAFVARCKAGEFGP